VETPQVPDMPQRHLLFTCRKCGWWALGTHHSDDEGDQDNLDNAEFDVKCTADDCDWTAKLQGKEGTAKIKSK